MSNSITQIKENLSPMIHSGTLNKVRNLNHLLGRVANTVIAKCSPLETIRVVGLSNTVHNILYKYSLPSDFNSLIDLYPQANRTNIDQSRRVLSEAFDLRKALSNKTVSIESNEGSKLIKIDWAIRGAKTLHNMNTFDGNGTWEAVGSADNVKTDTIYKYSGGGSVRFDISANNDGIQCNNMNEIDLENEDELADAIIPVYLPSITGLTSITVLWGNTLTTALWTGVAQTTQADGTAFRVGWNIIKIPWATAVETGTVDPTKIDTCKITFQTNGTAIADIRIDNIQFAIGYPFDIKYYSKFLFKNTAGTFLSQPTADDDVCILDNDCIQIFYLECLKAMAQQLEGSDSIFDINYSENELKTLYQAYNGEHQDQTKKAISHYGGLPKFR